MEQLTKVWEKAVEGKHKDDVDILAFYDKKYLLNRYGTKEEYIKSMTMFKTYAILTPDGEWHEPGKMGWFGTNDATVDSEKEFEENYFNILDREKYKNHLIVIVDCHI